MIWRHLFLRSRRAKIALATLLVYMVVSLVYFFLPWKVRMPVYQKVPQAHRILMVGGYKIMTAWDSLALLGRDVRIGLPTGARADLVYGGHPSQGFQLFGRVKQLENRGYVVGYSDSLMNPLWVGYRVFDVPSLKSGKRPSRFRGDPRVQSGVGHDDYTNSGFDRGHMAPNHAIATRYGEKGQKETFLMTNIIPQTPYVNRGIWKDLEMQVSRRYGLYFGEVWVITGPVFEKPVEKMASGVPIPSRYYKIIVDEDGDELRTLAFLIEADLPPYTRLKTKLVSIDEIEALTDLDFFPALSDAEQAGLESEPATRLWPWVRSALRYHF